MPAGFAGSLDFSSDDTVTVTADRAWEDDTPDVIHFSGKFMLRGPDWLLSGDSAVVYGKLDDPERVVVEGNPAVVAFLRDEKDSGIPPTRQRVDGTALFVEYFRSRDKLIMRGNASLVHEDTTLVGDSIEYDVDADRYSAGGEGGIQLQFSIDD